MRTDTIIIKEGFAALSKMLDQIEVEHFITLIKRDNSDYTEWRKALLENESIASLSSKAMESWNKTYE